MALEQEVAQRISLQREVAATKEELHRVQSQSQSAAAAENRAQGALEKAKVELRQAQADAALRTVQQQAERTAAEPTGRRGPVSDPNPNPNPNPPNPNPSPNPNPNPNPNLAGRGAAATRACGPSAIGTALPPLLPLTLATCIPP